LRRKYVLLFTSRGRLLKIILNSAAKSWHASGACGRFSDILRASPSSSQVQLSMKPRLFSTLRCLQHENPLVSWRYLSCTCKILIESIIGTTENGKYSAHAKRSARATTNQRCEESDCCILCERRSREIYNCRFAVYLPIALNPFN
jgi:hypothetical protein